MDNLVFSLPYFLETLASLFAKGVLVCLQARYPSKGLVTMFTKVWFFSSVDALVCLQVMSPTEGPVTVCAEVRFFSIVDAEVHPQGT